MDLAEATDKKVSSSLHPVKKYGFFRRSVFVKHLDYWRPWMFNFRDTDHMLLNRVRVIVKILKGEASMNMTPQRREFETSLGRFPEIAADHHENKKGKMVVTYPNPPWKAKKKERNFIDKVLPDMVSLPQV